MKCKIIETIFAASLMIFLGHQVTAQFLEPECGTLGISKRVVNGTDAKTGHYPWMAFLHKDGQLGCGGSLINHWFVLTAAHCITEPERFEVSLGVYDSRDMDHSNLYQVDRFFKHRSYVHFGNGSDIALVKLARKVEFTANIRPICILTGSKIKVERLPWFLAIGWGKTEPDGKPSNVLQRKIIERRDKSECGCVDSQICTVAESGSICYGDSGGPVARKLKTKQKSRYVQLGVISHTKDHCRAHGVFEKVLSHKEWINFVVGLYTPNDS